MHWLMIETGSNQPYIFGTSKQRLQVAASAAIWQLGYEWVPEAINEVAEEIADRGDGIWIGTADGIGPIFPEAVVSEFGCRRPEYGRLGDWAKRAESGATVLLHVVKASGKAEILVPDAEIGRRILRKVTRRALESGADIDVWGFISDERISPDSSAGEVARVRSAAFSGVHDRRYRRSTPLVRSPRLPFHQPCVHSGLPAVRWAPEAGGESRPHGRRVAFLDDEAKGARNRMISSMLVSGGVHGIGEVDGIESAVLESAIVGVEDLGRGVRGDWVGVLHADGNGIGAVFSGFSIPEVAEYYANEAAVLIDQLGTLSAVLEEITWTAFRRATLKLAAVESAGALRNIVLPIVVGGDDVVAIVSGDLAFEFGVALSREFREAAVTVSRRHDMKDRWGMDIDGFIEVASEARPKYATASHAVIGNGKPVKHLSLAVGLLVVKPKHPFHHAVSVAEDLTSRAKRKSRSEGVIAVHVLYEAAVRDLDRLLSAHSIDGSCYLGAPLTIAPPSDSGQVVGTVEEVRTLMEELCGVDRAGVSHSVAARLRGAITMATSKRDAAARFATVKSQDEYASGRTWAKSGLLLDDIAIDVGRESDFFADGSPTSFITAIELLDVRGRRAEHEGSDREGGRDCDEIDAEEVMQ